MKTHYSKIALMCKQTDEIEDHLNDLMSTLQELKIDCGISMQREVRWWKKDIKGTYALLLEMKIELKLTETPYCPLTDT